MAPPRVDGTSPAPLYDYGSDLGDTYVVQGETSLQQIAQKLHLDPEALAEANPQIKDGTKLLPLQEINLPQCSAASQSDAKSDSAVPVSYPSGLPPGPGEASIEANAMRAKLKPSGSSHPEPAQLSDPKGKSHTGDKAQGHASSGGAAGGGAVAAAGTVPVRQAAAPISPDEALDLAERGEIELRIRSHKGHQHVWESRGGTGEAPSVVNDGRYPARSRTWESGRVTAESPKPIVEMDYDKLNIQQQERARALIRAEDMAKGGNVDERPAIPEGEGAEEGAAADAAKDGRVATKQGMGVGDTVVDRAGQGAAAEQGANKAANRVTQKGVGAVGEGTTAGSEAAVAGEEGAAKLGGRLAIGMEALGFIGFMLEPLEMMMNFAGSYEEARNVLKHRGYVDGFSQGVAAAMKGVPQDQVRSGFGMETNAPDMTHNVAGDEGVDDRYHNKGLVDGYRFFQSLPPEKQKQLRDAAAANGWDLKKDTVQELERGVEPMVQDMFENAAAEAAAKAKAKADKADMERRMKVDHYGHNM